MSDSKTTDPNLDSANVATNPIIAAHMNKPIIVAFDDCRYPRFADGDVHAVPNAESDIAAVSEDEARFRFILDPKDLTLTSQDGLNFERSSRQPTLRCELRSIRSTVDQATKN